jgi:hypothetical protein
MSAARPFTVVRSHSSAGTFTRDVPFESVVVLVTSPSATVQAVGIADRLSRGLNVDVTVLAVQSPMALPRGGEALSSEDAEISLLHSRIRAMERMRLRVVVARTAVEALARLLPPESLVVVGGRRRWWWPTAAARLCRAIEALGHYVVFVDEACHAA